MIIKKLKLSLCFFMLFTLQADQTTLQSSKPIHELKEQFEKDSANIFFDLHNVLVTRNAWTFINGGIGNFGSTVEGIEKLYLASEFAQVLCRPAFYQGLWRLLHLPGRGKQKITEAYFDMIGKLGYKRLQKELIQFANNIFVVNPKFIPVLAELKKRGHRLYLFSNIGPKTFKDAQERNLFDAVLSEFEGNAINSTTIEHWKPEKAAYESALQYAHATREHAVMIDDKPSNLPTAEGSAIAEKKANKKGINYQAPEAWAAGILYNKQDHTATVNALKEHALLPNNF